MKNFKRLPSLILALLLAAPIAFAVGCGDGGGEVVAFGTPEEVAQCERSYTGHYLKKYLK